MSRLISGALVAALLITPALGTTPASAQRAPHAATGVETPAAPGVEVGPVRVVVARSGGLVIDRNVVTDRHGVSTTAFSCWSPSGVGSSICAARTRPDGTWGPAVSLAPGFSPQTVIDRAGRVTVGYRLRHGEGTGAVRWSGGSWHAPVVLAQPAPRLNFVPGFTLAANARGDTILLWIRQEEPNGGPHIGFIAAFRPHDGTWGPSVVVARKSSRGPAFLDSAGRAVVLTSNLFYRRSTAGRWRTRALPPFEGRFSGMVGNARGDMLMTGQDRDETPGTVFVFEKPAGAAWLPVVEMTISLTRSTTTPVVLDNLGRAAIGYKGVDDSFVVATRPAGGSWTPGVSVSAADVQAHGLRLEAGPRGALGACWLQREPGGARQLWASIRPPGGSWTAPVRLTGPRWLEVWYPAANVRQDGSLLVTWSGKIDEGDGFRIVSRLITPAS